MPHRSTEITRTATDAAGLSDELLNEELRLLRAQRRLVQFELIERSWLLVIATSAAVLAAMGDLPAAGGVTGVGSLLVAARAALARQRAPSHR